MTRSTAQRSSLVTGGAGFIGSHLVERLIDRGDHVVIVDNLSTGQRRNLASVDPKRIRIIEKSVSVAMADFAPGQFSEIYHLAAAVGVRLVIDQPIRTIETNVLETSALLRFAAASGTPTMLASSSEVYGKGSKSPFAEDDDVVYGPTVFSRWSYACSKAIDEYLALAHHRQSGFPVVIVRFFNTVGPRQVGEYGMVLPRFVKAAMKGAPLQVHGDGRQSRCFCDVRDVVDLLPTLLGDPVIAATAGRVFNMGRDEPIQIRALAELVIKTLNSQSTIDSVPYEQAFGAGFDDLRERRPDLTRLREAVTFQPRIPLEQTIRDLAEALSDRTDVPGTTGTTGYRGPSGTSEMVMPHPLTPVRKESRV